MNLIAEIEAEHIAELAKEIPDFRAGDTIRVGFKPVCRTMKVFASAASTAKASPAHSQFAKSHSAKVWSVSSRCTPPTSTASPWFAAAVCVAPNCTISARAVVNPRVSSRIQTTKHRRGKRDENRYTSRISHDQRENDRRHNRRDEVHMGQRRRPAVA